MAIQRRALAVLLSSLLILAVPIAAAAQQIVSNTATITADNGFTANGDGTSTVTTAVVEPIPTLSPGGTLALVVLLIGSALVVIRRQARAAQRIS